MYRNSIAQHLGGALAGKYFFVYGLGQDPVAGKNVDTSRFWIIFENSQDCMQIIGMSRRSIMRPNPPKCHLQQKLRKSTILIIKVKIP